MSDSHAATAESGWGAIVEFIRDYGALIGIICVFLIIGGLQPNFLNPANIANVLRQGTILVIIALGLTVVLNMRGVDLSVAQIADVSAVAAAALLLHGAPVWMAFVLPVILGVVIGGINALLAAYLGVPAIIATLGMMFVVRSGELIYTNGSQPQILFTLPRSVTGAFFFLGRGTVMGVPLLILLAIAVFGLVFMLSVLTPFGRQAKAVGANVRAAYLAGIDIRSVFALGFVVSGFCAGVAGVAMAARTGIAMPGGAAPYLLEAFAAAYLGTLVSRTGSMTIVGALVGALFVAFLSNGLTMLGFAAPARYAFNGGFILFAMAVGALRRVR